MQIRIQSTGAVMYESEFRAYQKANGGPSWDITTTEVLTALGADVVFEGAQATGGTVYQYSQASGVEQIDGKWYTKYILGPVFIDQVVDGVTTTVTITAPVGVTASNTPTPATCNGATNGSAIITAAGIRAANHVSITRK